MSFNGLLLRFIRFVGPGKPVVEFAFTEGLNVLWGASDTGKTFLVEAIDFMLGASELKDIPERQGYDRVLLGITASGKNYTLQRSTQGGNFLRFDGLLTNGSADQKKVINLSAKHSSRPNNLSHWLLDEIGLANKTILYSKESGQTKALGFRALAHLCVVPSKDISKPTSPIESGQVIERTREYGVFKLLLTGGDDSAVVPEIKQPKLQVANQADSPEVVTQLLASYEAELAKLTEEPEKLESREREIKGNLAVLQTSLRDMEGRLEDTTRQRKTIFARYTSVTSRRDEIAELQERFRLLDQQYSTDLKRLLAIEESGQFFVLMDPRPCPFCGASPEHQRHDSVCDGNVTAVTKAASAEIAKIQLLQKELRDTVATLSKENAEILKVRDALEAELRTFQKQIDAALTPEFTKARETYFQLIEQRASVQAANSLYQRVLETRKRLNGSSVPQKPEPEGEEAPVAQYLSKSILGVFSKVVESLLQAWHFPNATNVYFDEGKRDLVIGDKPRGSRGSGSCAITHAAFTIALLDYCRARKLPHPGFVVLDSPLLAYKEPQGDDENIAGTDLKPRFYEHLRKFIGKQQLFIVENTEPPADILEKVHHEVFTGNPNMEGRPGLFPPIVKSGNNK